MDNINKKLILVIQFMLIIVSTKTYANLTLTQEVEILKTRVITLERSAGPGIPSTSINHYIKTGNCTALTTQPTDACETAGTCYDTDDFVDTGANSLIGYTFTAVKSSADATDKDGGI